MVAELRKKGDDVEMARFHGLIGYAETVETRPSIYEPVIEEKAYTGDVIKNISRNEKAENLNDNINVNNQISIVADPYAYENFHKIKYVDWMGTLWKVTSIDVNRPRLILSIGGVYNGPKPTRT